MIRDDPIIARFPPTVNAFCHGYRIFSAEPIQSQPGEPANTTERCLAGSAVGCSIKLVVV